MAAEAMNFEPNQEPSGSADFSLSPMEVAKGEQAAAAYISSLKPGDPQRLAEEALDTLAAVISGGVCGVNSFPWHQIRPYHGALAFSILKEKGAPAHIEAMRCRADDTRKYQPVPEAYPTKQVQKIKTSFRGVMAVCTNLGFISEEMMDALSTPKPTAGKRTITERSLIESEVLALHTTCNLDNTAAGSRDSLMIALAYRGALKTVDLIALTVDHLKFDSKTGRAGILFKPAQAKRARRVGLSNENLIALEDWLEARGRESGPLFCPIGRAQAVDRRRMTAAQVRETFEQRALEAGVLAFSPNDLAKSSPLAPAAGSKKRAAKARSDEPEVPVFGSALFGDDEVPKSKEEEGISFPYHVRIKA